MIYTFVSLQQRADSVAASKGYLTVSLFLFRVCLCPITQFSFDSKRARTQDYLEAHARLRT